eukprot:CAMPEP_0114525240 /NCGR_PEP_ID=MMETSP0109-20121206/22308_1 /TAXON_ID=29199 /ORGANISM="Chlorarachnion reptans, Strain CCCM449" /LENGTH=306 /DNA_ID=CAMNT_0001706787 /DNA_START=187 /DNA_END=1107 /DNA_ORIENTATION=-
MVDGATEKEERKRLWQISEEQSYPQVFLRFGPEEEAYIGGYEAVHQMVENETFADTFSRCQKALPEEAKAKDYGELLEESLEEFLKVNNLEILADVLKEMEITTVTELRVYYEMPMWRSEFAKLPGMKAGYVARLKRALNKGDEQAIIEEKTEKGVDPKILEKVRSAFVRQDEEFFSSAFKGNDAKLNFDATIQIAKEEYIETVGLSKAVKGLMLAQKEKWNIELLKIILLPDEDGVKGPNTEKHGGSRNLINLLVVFAVKSDKGNLMSYLERLDIFPDDAPRLVKLMQANGLYNEADYLGKQTRC